MGHAYKSWWIGSDLTIEESRRLVPHQNATTMQVAISVVAAAMWMIENPEEGVRVPDDLPHEYILERLEALPRQLDLHPLGLDAAARLQERLQRLQQAGLRPEGPVAVQELPGQGRRLRPGRRRRPHPRPRSPELRPVRP